MLVETQASTTLNRDQSSLLHRAGRWGAVVFLRRKASIALVAALLPTILVAPAFARVRHNDAWARQEFARAERMREALNGRPAKQRTRREYQRAIDAYRRVYFGRPSSSKADPSVVATAELMVEMGRRFDDDKVLRSAIDEYRFLRKEYPGSKYRYQALFTIGEIYKDDLDDAEQARKAFEDFLHKYPRNQLADDARDAVKEIDDAAKTEKETTAHKGRAGEAGKSAAAAVPSVAAKGVANSGTDARRNSLPRVTGVRHWSTPDYTRVAIDVEQEVKFSSQRVVNPNRILFDIADTKLASTLVGKTFDVDDGFLKKIHVAETKPGQTQLVLEVDDLASYNAFLLPDPYRLIIDIHGKQNRAAETAKARETAPAVVVAEDEREVGSSTAEKSGKEQPRSTGGTAKDVESSKVTASDAAEAQNGSSQASEGTGKRGIVKTMVAVKGTDRRIPKTIVDDDTPKAKAARRRRGGTVVNGTETAKTAGTAPAADEDAEPAKVSKLDAPNSADAREDTTAREDSNTGSATEAKTLLKPAQRKKSRAVSAAATDTADLEMREARPTAAGSRSLTRALGLKIGKIVIDAGHGGHDTGTIGPDGLLEKDLVLDVAKRLGKLLEARLGAEVIYTRRDDTFIPLETRTAIANRERADLFISIHANSSRDEDARGVETYYLNFTSSPEALEVAARENAVSEKSVHELQDLVKKIALKDKIDESREFASDVQDSLYGGLSLGSAGIRNRGVKKAPFIVLIGANMPSILAEISFVSNPTDERKLETPEHRQKIAESLYRGVSRYAGGLSGVKVASKVEKTEGQ